VAGEGAGRALRIVHAGRSLQCPLCGHKRHSMRGNALHSLAIGLNPSSPHKSHQEPVKINQPPQSIVAEGDQPAPTPAAAALRRAFASSGGALLGQLAERNHRLEFCPASAFVAEGFSAERFHSEAAAVQLTLGAMQGDRQRLANLLRSAPGLVPFLVRRGHHGAAVGRHRAAIGPPSGRHRAASGLQDPEGRAAGRRCMRSPCRFGPSSAQQHPPSGPQAPPDFSNFKTRSNP
jgi:hypothetical protein